MKRALPYLLAALTSVGACAQDAGIADGGMALDAPRAEPRAYAPLSGVLTLTDGGVVTTIRGCWLDSPTCIDMAREKVELQERARLAEQKQVASPLPDLAVAYSAGLVTGAVVTLAVIGAVLAAKLDDSP